MCRISLTIVMILRIIVDTQAEFYEDRRCSCICPGLKAVGNVKMERSIFRDNIPASQCNCDAFVLPRVADKINGSIRQFCRMCECRYETRDTTLMMVVIVFLCWSISMLIMYTAFLHLLRSMILNVHDLERVFVQEDLMLINDAGNDSDDE